MTPKRHIPISLNKKTIQTTMNKEIQIIKVTVGQELTMKYDPILGTSYQLENVIGNPISTTEIIKNCKHNAKALIEIGERNYCSICGDWTNNPMNNI